MMRLALSLLREILCCVVFVSARDNTYKNTHWMGNRLFRLHLSCSSSPHPCYSPHPTLIILAQRHLQSFLPPWCRGSRSPVGLRRAACTWWSSHMSWRSPGWRWPLVGTSCPGLPAAMAACPWGRGTSHCCLRGGKKSFLSGGSVLNMIQLSFSQD